MSGPWWGTHCRTCSLVLPEDGGGAALGVTVAGAVERALERARNGGASLLLIDRAAVEALPAARWQQWRALLSERCIGIVHPLESVPAGDFDESHLIVRAKSGELYWMPILARPVARERINDIRPLLTRSSADVSVAVEDELEM